MNLTSSYWLNRMEQHIRTLLISYNVNTYTGGWYVFCLHLIVIIIVTYMLLWTNSLTLLLFGILVWASIIVQHIIFNGCWLVRLERRLWETQDWYGPWTPVFRVLNKAGVSNTKHNHNIVFVLFALGLTSVALARLFGMLTYR